MPIQVGSYSFDGPYRDPASLKAQSGVYAVLGINPGEPHWKVLDIGESESVRERVSQHDRSSCWVRQGKSRVEYAAYYCDERSRMRIEQELRSKYDPPCGKR